MLFYVSHGNVISTCVFLIGLPLATQLKRLQAFVAQCNPTKVGAGSCIMVTTLLTSSHTVLYRLSSLQVVLLSFSLLMVHNMHLISPDSSGMVPSSYCEWPYNTVMIAWSQKPRNVALGWVNHWLIMFAFLYSISCTVESRSWRIWQPGWPRDKISNLGSWQSVSCTSSSVEMSDSFVWPLEH